MFALYVGGIASAMGVAAVLKLWRGKVRPTPLIMELPAYRWPSARSLAVGLLERAKIFLRRVGGIILSLTVLLWFLSTYPAAPAGSEGPAIAYSLVGRMGSWLEVVFAPIGFTWQIAVALVPGMAAREVVVSSLGTVYALSAQGDDSTALGALIAQQWSLATALSLLVWFIFAPQCLSTLATVRRETGSSRLALVMMVYLFALAYADSFITYRIGGARPFGRNWASRHRAPRRAAAVVVARPSRRPTPVLASLCRSCRSCASAERPGPAQAALPLLLLRSRLGASALFCSRMG